MMLLSYSSIEQHSDDADLLVLAHDQPVEIKTRFGFFLERRFGDQLFEILNRLAIDRVAVKIRSRRQIDLGPRHVQKAEWIAVCESACFFGVHDVVRHARYSLGALGWRTQSAKGTNNRHKSSFIR